MLLERIHSPEDLKKFSVKELKELASEIRTFLVENVHETGGHLASNLGVIELTIGLHRIFDFKKDRIFFDVSHQSYVHKILTGRKEGFDKLRQFGGISGFTDPQESEYDAVKVGHAGTALSTALGLQTAWESQGINHKSIAFIGDASISNGVSFEALNHLGHLKKNLIIILNDNQMSISKTIGAVSKYLSRFISGTFYNKNKKDFEEMVENIPLIGVPFNEFFKTMRKILKKNLLPNIFEELEIKYFGPINGHSIDDILHILKNTKTMEGPILIHALTQKGRGFDKAEENPTYYHGISGKNKSSGPSFTSVFGKKMQDLAQKNSKINVITAAMTDGTGLNEYSEKFPERYYDVGIAEEHSVAFAAGFCLGGLKPYIAIYSTFMQRALDQLFQETSLQSDINPVFVLDRSGLVGEDGPTHHGTFDIAYTRFLPRFVLMSPKDGNELEAMLEWSSNAQNPVVIRFPKGGFHDFKKKTPIELGKAEILIEHQDAKMTLFVYGSLVGEAYLLKERLKEKFNLVNLRFAKPLDTETIAYFAKKTEKLATIEEHSLIGGIGEAVSAFLTDSGFKNSLLKIGLEDRYYPHGAREILLEDAGLNTLKLEQRITRFLSQ